MGKVSFVMPNRALEIHDSILTSIAISQGEAELRFSSVYIHQSEGIPGVDAGSGWTQKAILRVHHAEVHGAFSGFPVNLSDGQIQMGEDVLDNTFPIPLRYKGAFALRLDTVRQAREVVSIKGSGADLELIGEPHYVEEFRPTKG
jgi:hypothetical protein